jgi:nicotinate-nucleotide adenylyltransferase
MKPEGPLGIFGGTFDPVHRAHLQLARDACDRLGLAQVLWIPAGNPPHRAHPLATAEHRLAMVKLAIAEDRRFAVDDGEIRDAKPSYTVATLQRLRRVHGARPLVLLLGADAFLDLDGWHRWHELFALAHIAVATRPGFLLNPQRMGDALREEYRQRLCGEPAQLAEEPAGGLCTFPITPLDISASAIRASVAAQENAADLLPPVVLDYIALNHLYTDH